MFNNQTSNENYFAKGALEIGMRVREQERKLALMNAQEKADMTIQHRTTSNPFLILLTSIVSLVR
jgi:hypothetical protein